MVLEHGRNGGRGEVKDLGGVIKAWSDDGQIRYGEKLKD